MRLAHGVVVLACLMGLVTGAWSRSVAEAQQSSSGITREGTVLSIDHAASSFVLSMANGSPRQMTVLAQKVPDISVARQGAFVPANFTSLAVGDRVLVNMLPLANGQAVALSTQILSRGTRGSVPSGGSGGSAGRGSAGATSGSSRGPAGAGSSGSSSSAGSGVSVGASGSSSSAGSGVSAGANGSSSSAGSGVSAGASGSSSSAGGVSAGASASGSSAGGVSAGASGGGVSVGASNR